MADRLIAVSNQKGGTGKTTLALNLAAGLRIRGSTCLLDADPQRSASRWVAMARSATELPPVVWPGADIAKTIADIGATNRYVVVDCPPVVQGDLLATVMGSVGVVLIPVLPSPMDLWASVEMAAAVQEAKRLNSELQAFVVVNQLESRNVMSKGMREAVEALNLAGLKAGMGRRAAYRNAALEGTSVYGLGKRAQTAVADIEAIIEEVLCL